MILRYRSLRRWKYQTAAYFECKTKIRGYNVEIPQVARLTDDGMLVVQKGYCWDGPSGPTIDTKDFMRASLVHDVLYQMIRMEFLPLSCKDAADHELYDICIADGMPEWRATYVFAAVQHWAAAACEPGTEPEEVIYEAGQEE